MLHHLFDRSPIEYQISGQIKIRHPGLVQDALDSCPGSQFNSQKAPDIVRRRPEDSTFLKNKAKLKNLGKSHQIVLNHQDQHLHTLR